MTHLVNRMIYLSCRHGMKPESYSVNGGNPDTIYSVCGYSISLYGAVHLYVVGLSNSAYFGCTMVVESFAKHLVLVLLEYSGLILFDLNGCLRCLETWPTRGWKTFDIEYPMLTPK